MTRLSQLGELGLLAELERRGLIVGVEHDAARVGPDLVVTQDALIEGVHFLLDWLDWRDLGYRAAAVNLSDLAASGAEPEALLVTLAAPRETAVQDVVSFYEGIAETGVPVVVGDTTAAASVVVSVTALGRSERVPGRAGALPGDLLVVTGTLGGAGAAFRQARYFAPRSAWPRAGSYELLAALAAATIGTVIGRVEAGEGVELLLHGEPYELAGWQHFR